MSEPLTLIVGAGLGTTTATLWEGVAGLLRDDCRVVGIDLPGHGPSSPTAGTLAPKVFTVTDLADRVREIAMTASAEGREVWYAGVSLAGAVAFQLALDPGPIKGVAAIAAASTFGEPSAWHDRAALVRSAGTPVMVAGSSQRWFAPGFIERQPDLVGRMLHDLSDTDDESYASCCEALAAYDVRDALSEIRIPFLLAPGAEDVVVTPARASADAALIPNVVLKVFTGCGHQPPAEDPAAVAEALIRFMRPTS